MSKSARDLLRRNAIDGFPHSAGPTTMTNNDTCNEGNQEEDDLDLESLIHSIPFDGYDEELQNPDTLNNSGASDDSCTSLDNLKPHPDCTTAKSTISNGKKFFKSLPVSIISRRRLFGSHSDLSTHLHSSSPLTASNHLSSSIPSSHHNSKKSLLLERPNVNKKENQVSWCIWISDSTTPSYLDIELPFDATCSLLLHLLLLKLQRPTDLTYWLIMLKNGDHLIERIIEDHEVLTDIKRRWSSESIYKLCLCKDSTKYEILQSPDLCLMPGMVTMPSMASGVFNHCEGKRSKLQNVLTKTASEFCGWLDVRESGTHYWRKSYCVLRNSGFYCSTKNESKEQRHLQCFADVLTSHVWSSSRSKKSTSTSFCFCLKSRDSNEMRWLSADSEKEQRAWINAIRLIISGNRFYSSYVNASRRRVNAVPSLMKTSHTFSSSENNLVAMDFSGTKGRIISDPSEVAMMELEQQTSWRKKFLRSTGHLSLYLTDSNACSAPNQAAWISRSIHKSQPWFYGKISREDATEVLHRQGLLEGSYLVRHSHRIPGGYVITICHNQKIKHIPISQMEMDGQFFFSLDNGETRFSDLIQLVDFHRLNRGTLPCKLLHEIPTTFM